MLVFASLCQHNNSPVTRPSGFLQPIRVLVPRLRIHMHYCGPFTSNSKRNKYILLAICPMTKYIVAQAVPRANCNSRCAISRKQRCVNPRLSERVRHRPWDPFHQTCSPRNFTSTRYKAYADFHVPSTSQR